jgi:hypothetical protein
MSTTMSIQTVQEPPQPQTSSSSRNMAVKPSTRADARSSSAPSDTTGSAPTKRGCLTFVSVGATNKAQDVRPLLESQPPLWRPSEPARSAASKPVTGIFALPTLRLDHAHGIDKC